MIDGLAPGETTPGPLIMVVAFAGFVEGWTREIFGAVALLLAVHWNCRFTLPCSNTRQA
jgi:chromate transporter